MLEELNRFKESHPAGNRWFKVNLHVHGEGNDPHEMVKYAAAAEIDLLAITDHQTFEYYDAIAEAAEAEGASLTVLPGIEVTANEGPHLLAIFSKDFAAKRERFIGWLEIDPTGDTRIASKRGVLEIVEKVAYEGGIVIVPHPFAKGMGLLDSSRKIGTKEEWLESGRIRLMQVSSTHQAKIRYVGHDDGGDWINRFVLASASKKQVDESNYCLAPINLSDTHESSDVSVGCSWLRMAEPTVGGLRQVAFEPRTRISLEEPVPADHSRLVALKIRGGYCDQEEFLFNPALNCLIGQNYAGKSAVFDFIRFVAGLEDSLAEDLRDRLSHRLYGILAPGGRVELYAYHKGQYYVISRDFEPEVEGEGPNLKVRSYGDRSAVYVAVEDGSELRPADTFPFPLEVYEQGRIHLLHENIEGQLEMLDEFADVRELADERYVVLERLGDSAAELAPLIREEEELKSKIERLPELQGELAEKQKLLPGDEEAKWARSDAVVEDVEKVVETLESLKNDLVPLDDVDVSWEGGDIVQLFSQRTPDVGEDELAEGDLVRGWLTDLENCLVGIERARVVIVGAISDLVLAASEKKKEWKEARAQREREISILLREAGVTSPKEVVTRVNELRSQVNAIETKMKPRLDVVSKRIGGAAATRQDLRDRLRELQELITVRRIEKAAKLTEALDAQLKISIDPNAGRDDYRRVLADLCDEVTSRSQRIMSREQQIDSITKNVSPLELSEALRNRGVLNAGSDDAQLLGDRCGVTEHTVEVLCGIAADILLLDRLERVVTLDAPRIEVKRRGEDTYADLRTELSQGEQSAAILTLALQTRDMPLILDQPEDELGYSFVVDLIVPKMLDAKSSRQLLVITHNANIPVLGDADHVIKMVNRPHKEKRRECTVAASGCFESMEVTEALLELEGGEQAFKFRQDRYCLPLTGS